MYGIIVGISCLMALGLIFGVYHYITLQNQVGALAGSYGSIVRLEAFQPVVSGYGNQSALVKEDAAIDQLSLYESNGVVVVRSSTNKGFYSIIR